MARFGAGQFISFRYPPSPTAPGHTGPSKQEVLVLNPSYNGLMHAIDLMMLTAAERAVAHAIVDPEQRGKYMRIPLVQNAIRRMAPRDPAEVLRSAPMVFYAEFVKPFLMGKDAYRTYRPQLMLNVKMVNAPPGSGGGAANPKPLFKATADVKAAYDDIKDAWKQSGKDHIGKPLFRTTPLKNVKATKAVKSAYSDIKKSWKEQSKVEKPKVKRPKKGKRI